MMKQKSVKPRVYKALEEFQRDFLPDSYRDRTAPKTRDAQNTGIRMAERLVEGIRSAKKAS